MPQRRTVCVGQLILVLLAYQKLSQSSFKYLATRLLYKQMVNIQECEDMSGLKCKLYLEVHV